jgi:hypothetical protein
MGRLVNCKSLLGVRFDHDVTISKDCCHDRRAEDWMNENHNGDTANRMEGRKKEKSIFGVKPNYKKENKL